MKLSVFGKGLVLMLLLACANSATAAKEWLFQNVLIEDVIIGRVGGYTYVQIVIDSVGTFTGCEPTKQARILSYWDGGDYTYALQSSALAAQAQGLRVDILVETTDCSLHSAWLNFDEQGGPLPSGPGLLLQGIRIRGAQ